MFEVNPLLSVISKTWYVYVSGASLKVSAPREILHAAGLGGLATVDANSNVGVPWFKSEFHSHFPPFDTPFADVQPSGSELLAAERYIGVGTPWVTVRVSLKGPLADVPILASATGAEFAAAGGGGGGGGGVGVGVGEGEGEGAGAGAGGGIAPVGRYLTVSLVTSLFETGIDMAQVVPLQESVSGKRATRHSAAPNEYLQIDAVSV